MTRSTWQRHVIGASTIILLIAAALLFSGLGESGNMGLAASCLRMGIVFAVLWLAWPQALQPSTLMFIGGLLVGGLALLRFPMLIPYLIGIMLALAALSRLFNPRSRAAPGRPANVSKPKRR